MALAKVQSSPKVIANAVTISTTFSSQPIIGNSITVQAIAWSASLTTATCADNWGNTYSLIKAQQGGSTSVGIFLCSAITATGTPFTVTVTRIAAGDIIANACEVSGGPLQADQSASNSGTSAAPTTGVTAALTASEEFLVAVHTIAATQASITVESVSPIWNEEFEHLSFSQLPGEADTRIVTGASGVTQSCTWTDISSAAWSAAIAAFKVTSTASARLSQLPVETAILSDAPISLRLSQLPIEIAINTSIITSTETTQFVIIMP